MSDDESREKITASNTGGDNITFNLNNTIYVFINNKKSNLLNIGNII